MPIALPNKYTCTLAATLYPLWNAFCATDPAVAVCSSSLAPTGMTHTGQSTPASLNFCIACSISSHCSSLCPQTNFNCPECRSTIDRKALNFTTIEMVNKTPEEVVEVVTEVGSADGGIGGADGGADKPESKSKLIKVWDHSAAVAKNNLPHQLRPNPKESQ